MSIPKIIHQTWKDHNIPYDVYDREWVESWRKFNPQWEYRLWTDGDLRDLIAAKYSWFLPIYDSYPVHICRVDAARCFILHEYGGLYADLDFRCLKSFDRFIEDHVVLGFQESNRSQMLYLPNALMMSEPHHPFWQTVFQEFKKKWDFRMGTNRGIKQHASIQINHLTGCAALYRAVLRYLITHPNDISIYPPCFFYPHPFHIIRRSPRQVLDEELTTKAYDNAYATTYWKGTWLWYKTELRKIDKQDWNEARKKYLEKRRK